MGPRFSDRVNGALRAPRVGEIRAVHECSQINYTWARKRRGTAEVCDEADLAGNACVLGFHLYAEKYARIGEPSFLLFKYCLQLVTILTNICVCS